MKKNMKMNWSVTLVLNHQEAKYSEIVQEIVEIF